MADSKRSNIERRDETGLDCLRVDRGGRDANLSSMVNKELILGGLEPAILRPMQYSPSEASLDLQVL
jgi:hypothetical protein